MVYVDLPFTWPIDCVKDGQTRRVAARSGNQWCHMWADTDAELHAMAEAIGLKRAWHQLSRRGFSHYDLIPSKRKKALKLGAIEMTLREYRRKT